MEPRLDDRARAALVAGPAAAIPPAAVMALAGALSLGEPEDEVERLTAEAAARAWTDEQHGLVSAVVDERAADPLADRGLVAAARAELAAPAVESPLAQAAVRAAAFALLLGDDTIREHVSSLDEHLQGEDEERHGELALPLAGEVAMAAARIDLNRALHEAELYVNSYPKPDLAVGLLPELVTEWLAARMVMTEDALAARPRMTRAVAAYAEAAAAEFPRAAAGLRAVAALEPREDLAQDTLWLAFAGRIAARKLAGVGW